MPALVYPQFSLKMMGYNFLIPIRFCNPHKDIYSNVWLCMLDTGAHTSVIPQSITLETGHRLHGGKEGVPLQAAWGDAEKVYHHTFALEIMQPDDHSKVAYTLPEMLYDCTESDQHAQTILGAENFLRFFRIEFDYHTKQVTLHR